MRNLCEEDLSYYRSEAKRIYQEDSDHDIEIDTAADVKPADDKSGAWVEAWVWVDSSLISGKGESK